MGSGRVFGGMRPKARTVRIPWRNRRSMWFNRSAEGIPKARGEFQVVQVTEGNRGKWKRRMKARGRGLARRERYDQNYECAVGAERGEPAAGGTGGKAFEGAPVGCEARASGEEERGRARQGRRSFCVRAGRGGFAHARAAAEKRGDVRKGAGLGGASRRSPAGRAAGGGGSGSGGSVRGAYAGQTRSEAGGSGARARRGRAACGRAALL